MNVIELMKEAGFVEDTNYEIYGSYYHLGRFAALVREEVEAEWIDTNKALAKEIIVKTEALKPAEEALNAMLTHMGMDEDEWTKPTFNQAREALAAIREALAGDNMSPTEPTNINLNCKSVQARLATSWGYVKAEQTNEIDWIETNKALAKEIIKMKKQAEQEPVAEVVLRNQTVGFGRTEERKDIQFLADVEVGAKLYAAPVRTKDLTDDDLEKTYDEICRNASSSERLLFRYARAVIAADREKNK